MSQYGHPHYPQGQAAPPYPQPSAPGGGLPYPQAPGLPYPVAPGQPAYPGYTPYPQYGYSSASYPGQPNHQSPSRGQAPYPAPGQAPYPASGQAPYPAPGQASFPAAGQTRPPAPGQAPNPASGQAPYPATGQAPYPASGQAPYPAPGQTPYPAAGQAPYPAPGNVSQGLGPYPPQTQPQGQGPYPAPGQSAYPPQGQTQGQANYQPRGPAPYPGQGQTLVQGYPGPPGSTNSTMAAGAAGVNRPGADQFKSRVEIQLECKNLLNKDLLSKSDPCAVLYMMRGGRWEEYGRTENIKNNLNPKFNKTFVINYFFEEVQKLLIAVYDIDNATPQLTDDDFLGQLETTLGQLVSNTPFTAKLFLKNGRPAGQGTITIRTEEIKEGTESTLLTFRASKLDKKDFFGKSDPYLEIHRAALDGSWQMVHKTEVIKNNLNPSWRPFQLSLQKLCGGNRLQKIKIDCYDWDNDGSHDFIGTCTTTFEEMSRAATQEVTWPCINPASKAKKKSYTNSGTIHLTSCKIVKEYTFLDFVTSGMQINFTVGIDFTASNGNPSQSTSLHYINPHSPNEYMAAIKTVGEVCQDYDSDKLFPALGFGARIPPKMEISHEFALNFNLQNPYCQGIDGILQAYYNCIQQVQLYGPTNAAPIIHHVARFAAQAQREEGSKGAHAYFILLMLTDGVLSDMSNTKSAIVEASKLPMSLIIVGVGQADFSDMEILDGDDGVLRAANGEPAKRDIVQFVPFRDFKHSSPVELARHVLAEVPKQVTDYYKMRGLQPMAKPT
ncbi:copine-3-like isoform X2 [Physella acuta]|nr:copine-3-like isoform X2 [Physella acuta]